MEQEYIVTKYAKGKTLIKIKDPAVFYSFGQKLKLFHNNGFQHSHLEFPDVIYKDGVFTIVDAPYFMNPKKEQIHDIATLKISLKMYLLKRPWHSYIYRVCWNAFKKGYGFNDYNALNKDYNRAMGYRINKQFTLGIFSKIKGILMQMARKLGLY